MPSVSDPGCCISALNTQISFPNGSYLDFMLWPKAEEHSLVSIGSEALWPASYEIEHLLAWNDLVQSPLENNESSNNVQISTSLGAMPDASSMAGLDILNGLVSLG